MYKVIKIIYTVKTMEYLEAMEKRSKKIPQAAYRLRQCYIGLLISSIAVW